MSRRVMVTGGAGFIGSAVVRLVIAETDWQVLNVDKLTYAASPAALAAVTSNPNYALEVIDIADRTALAAVFDNHRRSDWTTYVYRTRDYGKTWKSLATSDINGYVHCIEEDAVRESLLFVGTEFDLFVSLDGGTSWFQHKHGLPNGVAVRALVVHPRENDLVIGTFGRSAYVIDDIRPLRALDTATLAKPFHMFEVAAAQQFRSSGTSAARFPGSNEFRGQVRPYGALLNTWIGVADLDHPDPKRNKAKAKPKAAVVPAAMQEPGWSGRRTSLSATPDRARGASGRAVRHRGPPRHPERAPCGTPRG